MVVALYIYSVSIFLVFISPSDGTFGEFSLWGKAVLEIRCDVFWRLFLPTSSNRNFFFSRNHFAKEKTLKRITSSAYIQFQIRIVVYTCSYSTYIAHFSCVPYAKERTHILGVSSFSLAFLGGTYSSLQLNNGCAVLWT